MSPNEPDTAAELLRRSQEGDAAALGALLERSRPYLLLLARVQLGRRLRVKVDLEDLVQETHLQAVRAFAQFRGGTVAAFFAWLRALLSSRLEKAVRHHLGTQARDASRERELWAALEQSSRLLEGLVPASPGRSPSSHVAGEEELLRVTEALERLSADYREVLVLRHLEGLCWAEVKEQMGRVSEEAARKLWARALAELRGFLGVGP